jgi:hypothetical protein
MSFDLQNMVTVPADEQWDETLDALAHVVTQDMADRGLIRDDAGDAARYHIRSFGRRLVNPLLDQVRFEMQAGQREAVELAEQGTRLRKQLADLHRKRQRDLRIAAFFGMLWTLLVLSAGSLVLGVWSDEPAQPVEPPAQEAPAVQAGAQDGGR